MMMLMTKIRGWHSRLRRLPISIARICAIRAVRTGTTDDFVYKLFKQWAPKAIMASSTVLALNTATSESHSLCLFCSDPSIILEPYCYPLPSRTQTSLEKVSTFEIVSNNYCW